MTRSSRPPHPYATAYKATGTPTTTTAAATTPATTTLTLGIPTTAR
ncbi:hypothetical protein [Streptomyces tritici]